MHTYIHIDGDWVGKAFQCVGNKNTQGSHYQEYLPNIIQSEPKWRRITERKASWSVSRKRIPPLKNVSLSWKVKPWCSLQGRSQKNKMGTSWMNLGAEWQKTNTWGDLFHVVFQPRGRRRPRDKETKGGKGNQRPSKLQAKSFDNPGTLCQAIPFWKAKTEVLLRQST